jgi:hypothetical protein
MAMLEVNAHAIKLLKPLTYPCHICRVIRHKLTNCLNKVAIFNFFLNVKVTIASINMVDVHVATTRSKTTKVHMLKEHEPKKNKSAID